jgi:hypothetical protein
MSGEARPPQPEAVIAAALAQLAALQGEVADLADARARDAARLRAQAAALRRRTRQLPATAARKAVRQQRRSSPGGGAYRPVPAPRWWQLQGRERVAGIGRLRAWVETVFRPGYGHLAAQVGPCWEEHDLCLYQLAWLSEMHAVIFLAPERLLTSEADWHTRLLPAAVALMAEETGRCDHLRASERTALTGADPWARAS